ncbi:MAG TPA: hypothetical protein VFN20_04155 [Candidatus Acidoferrum sp.]|nr:hypothetical protein [Candidatus Acidoferrum sp.]
MQGEEPTISLRAFRPICLGDLVRLGRPFDGGYVVNDRAVERTRYLLSFGINDDWSFEADFHNRVPEARILCFDHSVSKDILREKIIEALNQILSARFLLGVLSLNFRGARNKFQALWRALRLYSDFSHFFSSENVRLFSKGVSNAGSSKFFTISEIFNLIREPELKENGVFIKMDIEQAEFRVLPELLAYCKYVSGMAIEFHDLDIFWPNFAGLMRQLEESFVVAHLHGNNYCDLIPNSRTPKLLEVTLLKRDLIQKGEKGRDSAIYPLTGLDQPNDQTKEDYSLEF